MRNTYLVRLRITIEDGLQHDSEGDLHLPAIQGYEGEITADPEELNKLP